MEDSTKEEKQLLTPCRNLRKSNIKKGNLVARVKPDVGVISLTYFNGFKNCEPGYFLAGEWGTVEINLGNPKTISEEREIPIHRWSQQILPKVQCSPSKKYGGVKQIYYGNIEDVLKTINSLDMDWVDRIDENYLPTPL